MSTALPPASAAAVDVASGTTITANDNNADGTVVHPYPTKDKGACIGASVEFEVTCFGAFTFTDGT